MARFRCKRCSRREGNRGPLRAEVKGTRLMVLAEAPGVQEEDNGRPFYPDAPAGDYLRATLDQITDEFILTNACCCFSDSKPSKKQWEACRHHWVRLIKQHKPELLVICGSYAVKAVLGKGNITDYVGQHRVLNIDGEKVRVVFSYHPAAVLHSQKERGGKAERVETAWYETWDLVQELLDGKPVKPPKVTCLTNWRDVVDAVRTLSEQGHPLVSYDYETAGEVDARRPEMNEHFRVLSIGVATEVGAFAFPLDYREHFAAMERKAIASVWKRFLTKAVSRGTILCAHHSKYEHKCSLVRFGATAPTACSMLRAYTLDERGRYDLESVANRCKVKWAHVKGMEGDIQKRPEEATLRKLLTYNGRDALLALLSTVALTRALRQDDPLLEGVAEDRERFAYYLARLEMRGLHVSRVRVRRVRSEIEKDVVEVDEGLLSHKAIRKTEALAAAHIKSFKPGKSVFNASSHPQMRFLCLDVLKLSIKPTWDKKKRSMTKYSFDKKALEPFKDREPVGALLRSRSLHAMVDGFLTKWQQYLGPDGCVHSSFNQTVTATGRLSSTDPNLQNIPVHTEEGGRVRAVFTSRFRRGLMIGGDFAQLEPRLLAGWSGDPRMCEALNGGLDLHQFVAAQIHHMAYEDVDKEQRFHGKQMNLGTQYGQTEYGLSEHTDLTIAEALEVIETYNARFPGVLHFRLEQHRMAMHHGYVVDLFGARRRLPAAMSDDKWERERALRQAGNYPIQSTGNTFCLLSVCRCDELLRERKMRTMLVGTVHDNIWLDAPLGEKDDAIETLREAMLYHNDEPYWRDMPVPVKVDVKVGPDLWDMHELGT